MGMNNRCSTEDRFFLKYPTLVEEITHHEDAVFRLSDCARMRTLQFFSLLSGEDGLHLDKVCPRTTNMKAGHYWKVLSSSFDKFFFYTFLETVLFMNLQSTAFGLDRCVDPDHQVDWQLIQSLSLSVASTFLTFIMACQSVNNAYRTLQKAEIHDQNAWQQRHNEKCRRWGHFKLLKFIMLALLFLYFILWGVGKLYMNSHDCKCGWNIHFPLIDGCVAPKGVDPWN